MPRRLAAIAAVLALLAGGYVGRSQILDAASAVGSEIEAWSTRLQQLAEAEPSSEVGFRSLEGESSSVLMALGDSEGEAAFGLAVSDPVGPPVLLVVPQELLLPVPGYGEFRLVDALEFGGPELAALAITNRFGIRIDAVAALPAGSVSDGLTDAVIVDLDPPFFIEEADGSVTRVLPAGDSEIAPGFVEDLLVTKGAGDSFDWLQHQGAAWRAILAAVADTPGIADRITALARSGGRGAADLLVTVAGSTEAVVATVPVSRAEATTGVAALVPSPDQADAFMRSRFDHLLLRPEGRPRVEILNGNGRIGTTADVASILIRSGFRVLRTDNADDFDHEDTQIIAQGEDAEAAAREALDLIGRGLLFLEVRAPSGVVDVSIIVGHDIPSGEG